MQAICVYHKFQYVSYIMEVNHRRFCLSCSGHMVSLLPKKLKLFGFTFFYIRVITKLPNSEQSYKGKVKTHNYINRQNQSTTGKL